MEKLKKELKSIENRLTELDALVDTLDEEKTELCNKLSSADENEKNAILESLKENDSKHQKLYEEILQILTRIREIKKKLS